MAELISLLFVEVLDAYVTGLSFPMTPWDRTAPIAKLLASVVNMKGVQTSNTARCHFE